MGKQTKATTPSGDGPLCKSQRDAARHLGITPTRLRHLTDTKQLQCVQVSERVRTYRVQDLDAFANERLSKAGA